MSTTPSSTVYLQNIKLRAQTRLAEVQPAIDSKRREIDGLKNLRDAYERDRGLGDAGSVMEVSRTLQRDPGKQQHTDARRVEPLCVDT